MFIFADYCLVSKRFVFTYSLIIKCPIFIALKCAEKKF